MTRLINANTLRLQLEQERDMCRRELREASSNESESGSYWLGRAHGTELAIDAIDQAKTEATR